MNKVRGENMSYDFHNDPKENKCWSCKYFVCEKRCIEKSFFGEHFVTSQRGTCSKRAFKGKTDTISSEMYKCSKYERALDVELYLKNKENKNRMRREVNRIAKNTSINNQQIKTYPTKPRSKPTLSNKQLCIIFCSVLGVILLVVLVYYLSQCSLFVTDHNKLLNYIEENGDNDHYLNAKEDSGNNIINFEISSSKYLPETVGNNKYDFVSHASFGDNYTYEMYDVYLYFNLNGSEQELNGLSKGSLIIYYEGSEDYIELLSNSVNVDSDIILLSTIEEYRLKSFYDDKFSPNFDEKSFIVNSQYYYRQVLGATATLLEKANIKVY